MLSALLCAALLLTSLPAPSKAEGEAEDLTNGCEFLSPKGEKAHKALKDDNVRSFVTIKGGDTVELCWDESLAAQGVYLEWNEAPSAFLLEQLDASGGTVHTDTVQAPLLNHFYLLNAAARGMRISSGEELTLSTLHLYGCGTLPATIHDWKPPAEKSDLLLISAHCDDELLYFGGTIPTYAGERGYTVQLAYLAQGNRLRENEAMEGIWTCGAINEPIFLGYRDKYSESLDTAQRQWGRDGVVERLVELIRRTRPEVIITHDLNGEYGHGAHRMTASCVVEAVPLAADEAQFPVSARQYGVWQTKKLYLHLGQENPIVMDWRTPLTTFDGKTALEMANIAYACHISQLEYHTAVHDGGDFSCAAFGLAYSNVGLDENGGDFLENIQAEELTNYIPPTPSPTPEPTSVPIETSLLTALPEKTDMPDLVDGDKLPVGLPIGLGAAVLAAIGGVVLLMKRKKK
ncbi:MAG: PIG-L deacetylase family protein [Clostridia bacterium]